MRRRAKPPEQTGRAWPASQVRLVPIEQLSPYANNPRLHDEQQVDRIAASMERFGWTMPVLVDEQNELIAGHGRVLAAQKLRIENVPTMVAHGWSDAEKKAYRIADNQLSILSTWDPDKLKIELQALQFAEFNLDLTGFSPSDVIGFFTPKVEAAERRELTEAEESRLHAAWRPMLREWCGFHGSDDLSHDYTKGALAVHFCRAQLWGHEIPRAATTPYVPHRVRTAAAPSEDSTVGELLQKAAAGDDKMLRGLRFILNETPSFDKLLGCSFPVHGRRAALDFPAHIARALIDEFCPAGGSVLDPCHGWGGRMLGFLLSSAEHYFGVDADERTSTGVLQMFYDLAPFVTCKKTTTMKPLPFERVELHPNAYDFALTSPPYFDTEKYGGDDSSWRRYATYPEWRDGFYRTLIEKTAKALKPGAVFALQIGSQSYPLLDDALAIAPDVGLHKEEIRGTGMVNNWAKTDLEDGEVILILRKAKGRRGNGRAA